VTGFGGVGAPPLLFGLAPCGVYPAPDITIGAVRSYLRVPKRPAPFHPYQSSMSPRRPRDGGMFSVALSVSQAYRPLVDIPLRPSLLASTLPCGVRTFLSLPLMPVILLGPSRQRGEAAITRLARASFIIVSVELSFKGRHAQTCPRSDRRWTFRSLAGGSRAQIACPD
jgi:hypothetical protein